MSEEATINGCIFYIDRLDAFSQLEVMGDLQKDVLPAVGGLFGALTGEGGNNEDAFADAIGRLSQNLTGKQLKYWCDRLLTKDTISVETEDGVRKLDEQAKRLVFDDFSQILELLYHVLRVNFQQPLTDALTRFGVDLEGVKNLDVRSELSAIKPDKSS